MKAAKNFYSFWAAVAVVVRQAKIQIDRGCHRRAKTYERSDRVKSRACPPQLTRTFPAAEMKTNGASIFQKIIGSGYVHGSDITEMVRWECYILLIQRVSRVPNNHDMDWDRGIGAMLLSEVLGERLGVEIRRDLARAHFCSERDVAVYS